mmetsp:Transcript_28387/g.64293  ORF Transcript_28387/g.64293 Transcript_28387/m.64293 type:complete len:347 (-) Transcript_28387:483-1523(-)
MKAYEAWPSRNRFCCGGRIMCGPAEDVFLTCGVWLSILLPSLLFFWQACPALLRDVGPFLPTAGAILFGTTVCLFCLTSYTDPGVIPRRAPSSADPPAGKQTRMVWIPSLEREVQLRWCVTCKLWRPPRSSHCSSCDNCVLAFDHHCPFVGNCIGLRNYGWFSSFLLSVQALAVVVLIGFLMSSGANHSSSLEHIQGHDEESRSPVFIAVGVLIGLLVIPLTGLVGYHCMLVVSGSTTKERWVAAAARGRRMGTAALEAGGWNKLRDDGGEGTSAAQGVAEQGVAEQADGTQPAHDEARLAAEGLPEGWLLEISLSKCEPCIPSLLSTRAPILLSSTDLANPSCDS